MTKTAEYGLPTDSAVTAGRAVQDDRRSEPPFLDCLLHAVRTDSPKRCIKRSWMALCLNESLGH